MNVYYAYSGVVGNADDKCSREISTPKITWIFLFFGTDVYENRAHIHAGKRETERYCKIWLEPEISIAKNGSLTTAEINEVLTITTKYHAQLTAQWKNFSDGKTIKMITIKK